VGQQLDDKAAAMPTHKIEISGLVADVSGNSLVLNVGSKSGVRLGDVLQISRVVRTVKDPATGKVIKSITNKIGMQGYRGGRELGDGDLYRKRRG